MSFKRIAFAAAVSFGIAADLAVAEDATGPPPRRVVSMNLCTDQLAMLLAGPGQLHSVSHIALDPRSSAMTKEAAGYVINHGLAEEIYLMQPDLVLAGAYSGQATVRLLRRLGIPVVRFQPANSLEDVGERIEQMGAALHQIGKAQTMRADFEARLADFGAETGRNPRAILYYANGYSAGDATLAGRILLAAGFANAAGETGLAALRKLPLEVLAMANPDIVITARRYPGTSRSEQILDHPVVQALRENRRGAVMSDQDWVCGTPYVLRAIETLSTARRALTGER